MGHEVEAMKSWGSGRYGKYFPDNYEPCQRDNLVKYLKRTDVRKALHVTSDSAVWDFCNRDVSRSWSVEDMHANMIPYYPWLIKNGDNLKVVIYSGDDDG